MGAGGSKACGGDAGSDSIVTRARSRGGGGGGGGIFGSSCIGLGRGSRDSGQVSISQNKDLVHDEEFRDQVETETDSDPENVVSCRKARTEIPFGFPCVSPGTDGEEWGDTRGADAGEPQSSSSRPLNSSRSFLSRFNLFPSSSSFRMSRATGAGSSRGNQTRVIDELVSGSQAREGNDLLPAALNNPESSSYRNWQDCEFTCDFVRNGPRCGINVPTVTTHTDSDSFPPRPAERRTVGREPAERNVRFSRSLSVGRLRDRVLRRSSASDTTVLPLRREEEVVDVSQRSGTRASEVDHTSTSLETGNVPLAAPSTSPLSNIPINLLRSQHHGAESSLPREIPYHDVLEHRSNFLERRRRIRSQVRALQRLGNRFENLSGHGRACIMSGHHRTGRCTCRTGTRDANTNEDSNARGSISRIVMLAEALFEVLDEMHQQSVVLSSQPSMSSIGSIPAPSELVDSLPVKSYSKSKIRQVDDVTQCYVCLLEYEDGDKIRVLPCHHEFHKTCIDKWLKEIHRVCPLCRGDVCRAGSPEGQV